MFLLQKALTTLRKQLEISPAESVTSKLQKGVQVYLFQPDLNRNIETG